MSQGVPKGNSNEAETRSASKPFPRKRPSRGSKATKQKQSKSW